MMQWYVVTCSCGMVSGWRLQKEKRNSRTIDVTWRECTWTYSYNFGGVKSKSLMIRTLEVFREMSSLSKLGCNDEEPTTPGLSDDYSSAKIMQIIVSRNLSGEHLFFD